LLRTNYYKNSFSYSGAVLWNSLPCDLREAKFKRQVKRDVQGTAFVENSFFYLIISYYKLLVVLADEFLTLFK